MAAGAFSNVVHCFKAPGTGKRAPKSPPATGPPLPDGVADVAVPVVDMLPDSEIVGMSDVVSDIVLESGLVEASGMEDVKVEVKSEDMSEVASGMGEVRVAKSVLLE